MVIKASAASEIRHLVDALGGTDDVRREAAIARLGIIGPRAVDRLVAAYREAAGREVKIAILRALEGAADARTVGIARDAIRDGGDLGCAAVAALGPLLDLPAPAGALDALVEAALDRGLERRVRLAACEAIQHVPGVGARVAAALREDPDAGVMAAAGALPAERAAGDAVWQDALEGRLPDDPGVLRGAAASRAAAAPLAALQKLIDLMRAREGGLPEGPRREGWRAARGFLHQALALRGSRIAVYDLRETLEQARGPLPVSFLAALHVVGDESCLEPLGAAWERAPEDEARWRHQVGAALRAIAGREKISRRHAAFRRLASRWPAAARQLSEDSAQ